MSMSVTVTTKDGAQHIIAIADTIESIGSFMVCSGPSDSIWVPVSDIVLIETYNHQ